MKLNFTTKEMISFGKFCKSLPKDKLITTDEILSWLNKINKHKTDFLNLIAKHIGNNGLDS